MFQDGPIDGLLVREMSFYEDGRGSLAELFRIDELEDGMRPEMGYVSMTLPGVVRGPHAHHDQTDLFAFYGPGDYDVFVWDDRPESATYRHRQKHRVGQSRPAVVIIPPGIVHAYKNVSDVPAWTTNCPDRLYGGWQRKEPVDEIRHEEQADSPFELF